MEYYGHNDYRDYLSHHGILGQKWGKRNGPPYPIAYGAHSASEKKAGWRDSLRENKKKRQEQKEAKRQEKAYSELAEAEKRSGAKGVFEYITSNRDRDYIEFQNKSESVKTIRASRLSIGEDQRSFNYIITQKTSKALGAVSYEDYMRKNGGPYNIRALTAYYAKGLTIRDKFLKTNEGQQYIKRMDDNNKKYAEASKSYEKECREFVKNKLGDYSKKECTSDMALKFDLKTGKMGKQTMEDMVSIEMLRRAGGKL